MAEPTTSPPRSASPHGAPVVPRVAAMLSVERPTLATLARDLERDRAHSFRLPRQLIWLYLLGPVLSAPLMLGSSRGLPLHAIVRSIAASYLPFLAIPAACHAVYAGPLPARIARLRSGAARIAAHAVLATVTAIVVGVAIKPLMNIVSGADASMFTWLSTCAVITNAFILPTQLVQDLRARARSVELRMQLAHHAATEAQLAALQSRTNPHFLFNSINTVASLIPEDPVLAERSLERLAEILRFSLASIDHRTVPLRRELEITRDYLELQAARFGTGLRWTIDADPTADDLPVPPLTLQPLVENAVLHGTTGRSGGGTVRVVARRVAQAGARDELVLEVSDDGPGPDGSVHRGTGTGLRDLSARLALVYGTAARLETGSSVDRGYRVVIRLPVAVPA